MKELLSQEIAHTVRRPFRLFNLLRPGKVLGYLKFQRLRLLSKSAWAGAGGDLATRQVASYDAYLELQRSKLQYLELQSHEARFRDALRTRLEKLEVVSHGSRVLCLGARLGAEVAAFRDLGCFAFGVDLNPGTDNPWVLYGDFHKLEYPNHCLDAMYSNSLDHCLEPERVLAEAKRILRPGGALIIEADPGLKDSDGIEPDMWATFQWETVDALKQKVCDCGFQFVSGAKFDYPRHGTRLLFVAQPYVGE